MNSCFSTCNYILVNINKHNDEKKIFIIVSFFLKLVSRTPQTILSVIILSLSAPKLHLSERDLKFHA